MSEIQYTYKYKLQLDCRGFQNASSVVLQNDKSTTAIYNNISMVMSLYGVTFHRKVYEPGNIQAEILIQTSDSDIPTVDLLTTMLIRRPVSLLVEKSHYAGGTKTVDAIYTVAEKYYIHEISPQFERRKTRIEVLDGEGNPQGETVAVNWIYIKLDIYSPDKLLTLSKYSQAHFGETLFGDILTNNIDSFQLRFKSTAANTITNTEPIEVDTRHLSHLGYTEGTSTTQKELIQPYLVQYNESFYDFLRRTANRCGEVFYFEDGKLCAGIPEDDTATPVSGARRIVFQRISEGALTIRDYARDALKEWDATNETYEPGKDKDTGKEKVISDPVRPQKDGEKFPDDAFPDVDEDGKIYSHPYNSEIASEDHYLILFKDKFAHDSVNDLWCGDDAEHTMRTVSLLLNSTSLMELLTNFGLKEMESSAKAKSKADEITKAGNKNIDDNSVDPNKKYIVFPNIDNDRDNHWITLNYVKDIRDKEETQMRGMVCVDMGTGFQEVKLGDKITLPSPNHAKTYVVVQIEMTSGKKWQRSYDGFVEGGAPLQGEQSQRFYAIPMAEITKDSTTTKVFYPPLLPGNSFRRSGAQPAFVVDSKDPAGQGRVRIRYPWQPQHESEYDKITVSSFKTAVTTAKTSLDEAEDKLKNYATDIVISEEEEPKATKKTTAAKADFDKAFTKLKDADKKYKGALKDLATAQLKHIVTEAASPWIRVATPMATPGGGMFFCPEKGDEVMVGYENGNVERPYVTGMLYSKNVPAPKEGGRVIVSKNGHTIKMSDPGNSSELLSSLLPPLKMLTMYGVKFKGMDDVATRAMGGIELTDQLGFYNIKMSSHDRRVSISSPFGTVNINALTGISIDAPNGDISITGKNVSISAYNKISFSSGKNIKLGKDEMRGGYWTTGEDWEDVGKHVGKSVSKLFGIIGNFFDYSLIRTLLEVFIRPVDGTFEIKSERFLLLGAGGRTPSGEFSDYNVKPLESIRNRSIDVDLFQKMLTEIRSSLDEWVHSFTVKYNNVIGLLTDGSGGGIHISEAWTADHSGAVPLSAPADLTAMLHLMAGSDPANLKTRNEIRAGYTHDIIPNITFTPSVSSNRAADILLLEGRFIELFGAMMSLKRHLALYDCNHLFHKISDFSIVSGYWAGKRAKKVIPPLMNAIQADVDAILTMDTPMAPAPPAPGGGAAAAAPVAPAAIPPIQFSTMAAGAAANGGLYSLRIKKVIDFIANSAGAGNAAAVFSGQIVAADVVDWRKAVLRRIMCKVIETVRSATPPYFDTFVIPAAKYEPLNGASTDPAVMVTPFNDTDWTKYVNEIRVNPPESSEESYAKFGSGLGSSLLETVEKIIPFESDTWSSEKEGQILFSETKGSSYHFTESGATVKRNNEGTRPQDIRNDLKNI